MCFIADLEAYCPPELDTVGTNRVHHQDPLPRGLWQIRDADNLVINQTSRMSEHSLD